MPSPSIESLVAEARSLAKSKRVGFQTAAIQVARKHNALDKQLEILAQFRRRTPAPKRVRRRRPGFLF